jgi:hypothetical protein
MEHRQVNGDLAERKQLSTVVIQMVTNTSLFKSFRQS